MAYESVAPCPAILLALAVGRPAPRLHRAMRPGQIRQLDGIFVGSGRGCTLAHAIEREPSKAAFARPMLENFGFKQRIG